MSEHLSLNPATGCYEATIIIKIDVEIFQRAFFRYVEENHVNLTDPEAIHEAITQVAKVSKWVDHPRTQKVSSRTLLTAIPPSSPAREKETLPERSVSVPSARRSAVHELLTPDEVKELRERAMYLPVDQWETLLLTPLVHGLPPGKDRRKDDVYRRRSAERKVLEQLKHEIEPAREDMLAAVASAVNGTRLK